MYNYYYLECAALQNVLSNLSMYIPLSHSAHCISHNYAKAYNYGQWHYVTNIDGLSRSSGAQLKDYR